MTPPSALFRRTRLPPGAAALLLLAVIASGCSGNKDAPSRDGSGASADATSAGQASATSAGSTTGTSVGLVRDSRTKWINDIPYDVWFDRPLEVYQDNTPLTAAATPDSTPVGPPTGTPDPEPPATNAAGANDAAVTVNWDELVSADILIAEVKELRVRLAANLQTVATFNKASKAIPNDAMVLSAIAGIVERSTHAVNWKDKARYVRDLAYQITTVGDSGREAFEKAKDAFDKIVTILDGGPPPDMEAADQTPFADYVSRGEMMKRIESSLTWLKSDVNTESRLKEDHEQAVHAATLLRALGTVCGDSGYEFAEEPGFQEFVRSFVAANSDVAKAAAEQNFTEFEAARGRLQNSCGACHSKYKDTGS